MGSRIELLSLVLPLICQIVRASLVDNSSCDFSLTVPLEEEKVHMYENGSLFHEGILYPSHLYWIVDDVVRGCICELRPCLRKCCQDGEVLSDGEVAECIKSKKHAVLPALRLEKDQLAPEIQNIQSVADHFALVRNRICPYKLFKLEPEVFAEDKFALEENGTLLVGGVIHPQRNFCMDWHESLKKVVVLKCHELDPETALSATQTIYPIMTIVSVPFLIVTFLVYAIIPELRNIYGKTLMCYVACLVTAYCALINAQFKYLPPGICASMENATTVRELPIVDKKNSMEDYVRYCLPEGNCLSFCCPPNHYYLPKKKCERIRDAWVPLPAVYTTDLTLANVTTDDVNFRFLNWNPCEGGKKHPLDPSTYHEDRFYLLRNGTFYLPYAKNGDEMLSPRQYCLAIIKGVSDEYLVLFCVMSTKEEEKNASKMRSMFLASLGMIASIPFLLATFLVYSVIKELRNLHGFVLRGYVGSLAVAYTVLSTVQIVSQDRISNACCILLAFVIHFSFLASFFWLNIMCFDIWWTFGGFRALRGSIQQRDQKKFIMYSIYAWGSASLLTGVCLIMDFAPNIPKNFIRPKFGSQSCWFNDDAARAIYFYGPMGITVLCNICLFISTAIKIQKHKRDTAHHLKGSESRRHDDHKQWFNLYLKLFIVMGINWSMEIVSWLCDESPDYVWYITDLANTLQGVIIFIIFVCKDKIKRLLLKRFGCRDSNILTRNSTRSVYHSSASRTCTTSTSGLPLREKVNTHIRREPICSNKESADESDCA